MVVDLVIVLFFVGALLRGRDIGLVRQVFSAVGFFGGLLLGAIIAPRAIGLSNDPFDRLLITVVITIGLALIFLVIFEFIGSYIKRHLPQKIVNSIDSITGAVLGGVTILVSAWLVAAVLSTVPINSLGSQFKQSYIISELNKSLPPAPSIVAKLGYILNPNGFPEVFLGNEPIPPKNIVAPNITGQLKKAVDSSVKSVVKIEGLGCGGVVEGSGFIIGQDLVATNAHVVSGIMSPYIFDQSGRHDAKVILFDPNLDFAILDSDNLGGQPLTISTRHIDPLTHAAVMGYPGGGDLKSTGATVIDSFIAEGKNIYNQGKTERRVHELKADIRTGNSGGPLIASDGSVIGVVFAKSTSYQNIGYALDTNQVVTDINLASASNRTAVSTGQCAG